MSVQVPAESMDLIEATIIKLRDDVRKQYAENESLRKDNRQLVHEWHDALDTIEDLRTELRTKDSMISELRAMLGMRKTDHPDPEDFNKIAQGPR